MFDEDDIVPIALAAIAVAVIAGLSD